MRTQKSRWIGIIISLIFIFYSTILNAQNAPSIESNLIGFKQLMNNDYKNAATEISKMEVFKYRKILREARLSKEEYHFNGVTFSKLSFLKHLKKAARKSTTLEKFKDYFLGNDLHYITDLDQNIVSGLYLIMRKSTFNSYLELLSTTYISFYTIENSI